jgi:hypothetical protein
MEYIYAMQYEEIPFDSRVKNVGIEPSGGKE